MVKANKEGQRKAPILRFKGFTDDWEQRKLKELVKLITKGTTPHNYGGDINFIKVENIEDMLINPKVKISEFEHTGKLKRSILKENDILFSIAGSLGKVGLVDSTILPANTNQALAIIRLNNKIIRHSYIYNYLKSNYIQHFIRRLPSVGAQPNLSLKQINELLIKFPGYCEQQKISNMLNKLNTILTLYERKITLYKLILREAIDKLTDTKDLKSQLLGSVFETITDYVANGSFKSLKENVAHYSSEEYAYLIRLQDYNNHWNGPWLYTDKKDLIF